MRIWLFLLFIIAISCNHSRKDKYLQRQVDSLKSEIYKLTSAQTVPGLVIAAEHPDSPGVNNGTLIKSTDIGEKETPKKTTAFDGDEAKHAENVKAIDAQEEAVLADERNAVLKNVVTDKPNFRPQLLGGFKDIRFNLFNRYAYTLEEVILKVHYVRVNGTEIKSEMKIVKDVAPKARIALTAPDYTSGGKEIQITVDAVRCRAIHLCYYPADRPASADPYRCQ